MKRVLVIGSLPLMAAATLSLGARAQAATSSGGGSFDAYIASGDASCAELTVNISGYSFIVEPDVRIPRATSSIAEGQTGALAAPADPGDSVDALPGLLFPREEGQVASGVDGAQAQTMIPFPQDAGHVGTTLVNEVNPFNPTLEYPYEHASASYPDPNTNSGVEATYLNQSNVAYSDPSGLFTLDGTSGDAKAGSGYATAHSGAGTALSVPKLGVTFGRVASSASALVSANAVTDDVTCTLHDVSISPPGSGHTLHIGTLAATLHTERSISGAQASSSHSMQLSDVTFDGQNLTSQTGNTISVPQQLQNISVPQTSACAVLPQPQCSSAPPPPASVQSLQLGGTTSNATLASNGNQVTSTLTAATMTLQTTTPVPASIPSGPPPCLNGNPPPIQQCLPNPSPSQSPNLPITSAPTTYTLQLANLSSSAYGFVAPPATASPLPGALSGGTGATFGLGSAGGGAAAIGAIPGTHPTASSVDVAGVAAGIRWPVVGIAALMESLLLASLYLRRRALLRSRSFGPSPQSYIDLP